MDHSALQATMELTNSTMYIMGSSFILGSLFTILILMFLDFLQRDRETDTKETKEKTQ